MYCKTCGTELIENVCPICSQAEADNDKGKKIAKQFFVSPNEKMVAVLGDSYVEKFMNNGNLESGFAVVSDKRVYFQGTSYSITHGANGKRRIIKTKQSRTVDLKDITGTGFDNHANIGWLIAGFVCLIPVILLFFA